MLGIYLEGKYPIVKVHKEWKQFDRRKLEQIIKFLVELDIVDNMQDASYLVFGEKND